MADRVGQHLGNYRLLRLLGQGGFADVYLGEHLHLNTQAAIKVLHTHLTSQDIELFRTEARTIARLVHPHIVRILDFDVQEDLPFLVMDYAPRGTLRKHHPPGAPLPLVDIISYVQEVAAALQYAHAQGLIHRDIKPENLLLGGNHEVLLSDFGLAIIAQSARSQKLQETAGTIAYMAPEQLQGHPRPASDQYALGILVYEWLSGAHPFHGSFVEIASQHLSVSPPSLRTRLPTLPPAVEDVVMRALAKDPEARFASVQTFAMALEEAWRADASGRTRPALSSPGLAAADHRMPSRLDLPWGTVTLLFTGIEESTRLLQQLGDRYSLVMTECRNLLRAAFRHWNGHEVETHGDIFFVAFARATDAVSAAVERRTADERDKARGGSVELVERERALPFRGAHFHAGDQAAEIAVPVGIFDQQYRPLSRIYS